MAARKQRRPEAERTERKPRDQENIEAVYLAAQKGLPDLDHAIDTLKKAYDDAVHELEVERKDRAEDERQANEETQRILAAHREEVARLEQARKDEVGRLSGELAKANAIIGKVKGHIHGSQT